MSAPAESATVPVTPARAHPADDPRSPAARVLLGIAAGDAAGWPAGRHRAHGMPAWTRRLARELDLFAEQGGVTTLPVPVALNQAPGPLRLGPSDDAEWAALTAYALLDAATPAEDAVRAALDRHWTTLAAQLTAPPAEAVAETPADPASGAPAEPPPAFRARISVRTSLANLAAGLAPPACGHDNPHYFDDAACVRAAVLATRHPGAPGTAAALAEYDARYTQDGDGVLGARAVAAAVAAGLGGADAEGAVGAALAELPPGTAIGRAAREAVTHARRVLGEGDDGGRDEPGGEASAAAFALVPVLEHEIVDHVYSYGVAAAETVPVALALALAARGRLDAALPAAACLARVADSAPALTGALTGALGAVVPAPWRAACRWLSGCAVPRLSGTDLLALAARLDALATARHREPTRGPLRGAAQTPFREKTTAPPAGAGKDGTAS
ncbi:ADP-ribosylglycohydrolase family protein [Streptomyces evansiae]|uniref:ADP-ribosylglycohydrolase family protein n=1 Tax=Streptomyces evansiae TaxID=3075535 RepID=UPI002887DD97|nr:ADP-ribosylglycohydrolase family protein [Streptomyces sp. DSM 41859]MDT0420915.1 ADP-ribosylglycohydrolase family protein [Streptomyces sp. DSM 41859]